jgi:hypothetical protein
MYITFILVHYIAIYLLLGANTGKSIHAICFYTGVRKEMFAFSTNGTVIYVKIKKSA